MRYVTIPEEVFLVDPITKKPMPFGEHSHMAFAMAVRVACSWIASQQKVSPQTLRDIMAKFDDMPVGHVSELTEDEWKLLEPIFREPETKVFGHPWFFCGESHQRAVTDAPTKRPS